MSWGGTPRAPTALLWVVARSHRLSSEDAADAVQMTWLRCVERLDQIRDPESIAAWLTTICRRESLAIVRRLARARSEPIADDAAIPDRSAQAVRPSMSAR
jgi:RNA polymerase sigma factor (sigma-70 family)